MINASSIRIVKLFYCFTDSRNSSNEYSILYRCFRRSCAMRIARRIYRNGPRRLSVDVASPAAGFASQHLMPSRKVITKRERWAGPTVDVCITLTLTIHTSVVMRNITWHTIMRRFTRSGGSEGDRRHAPQQSEVWPPLPHPHEIIAECMWKFR